MSCGSPPTRKELAAGRHRAVIRQMCVSALLGVPQLSTAVLVGHAAFSAGDLAAARQWLQQACDGFKAANETMGWTFHGLLSLTQTLAMSGEADAAARTLVELEQRRCPGFAFLEADVLLARAWVAAAQGAVTEAVRLAARAAEKAVVGVNRRSRCWLCRPRPDSVTAPLPDDLPSWPPTSTAPAHRRQQPTPPRSPPTTVTRCRRRPPHSSTWVTGSPQPTPPRRPRPSTPVKVDAAPH